MLLCISIFLVVFAFKSKFQIMHKFRGSSCLSHTSQSDDVFQSYLSFVEALIYMLSSITKRGRLKVQLSLGGFGNSKQHIAHWANAIPILLFQEAQWMAWHGWGKWIPQNSKDKRIGSSSKAQDSTFYLLVIQDHIESIGKANTIKEGWGVA